MARPSEPRARILPRTRIMPNGCIEWTGAQQGGGYGTVVGASGRQTTAHRAVYELLVGPIPEGLTLDHLCRNRICVSPAHLEPVTRGENTLRGNTITAQHKAKTHCIRGHELSGDNLCSNALRRGVRDCRACRNERKREAWHARRR